MMSSGGPWTCQEGRDRRGPRTRLWWSYKICSWSAQLWIWAFYPSPINLLAKVSNSLNCASAKIKNLFKIEAEVEARIMKMPITTWKFKLQSLFSIQEWDPAIVNSLPILLFSWNYGYQTTTVLLRQKTNSALFWRNCLTLVLRIFITIIPAEQ